MHHHRLRGGILGASVLLLVSFVLAGPAHADSVVYLKDGNVWIANTDGSGARQFTQYAYNWAWPSEDDNGNVVVAGGLQRVNPDGSDSSGSSELYRFQPDGNQIAGAIPTWGSYSTPSCPTYGPTDVRVSPDGSKIAYSELICGSQSTALWTPSDSTGLNFPNQANVGQQDYFEPAWIDSTHFLATHSGPTLSSSQAQWFVHDTGGANYSGTGWSETQADGTGFQGVVNRTGTRMAVFNQDAADYVDGQPRNVKLLVYSAPNLATAETSDWSDVCSVTLDATKYPNPNVISPSFSPDGSKLLWADSDGVQVASVANVTKDGAGNCTSIGPATLIPGGAEPFYGKGNVAPGAADPNQPGKPAPTQQPPTTTTTTTTPTPPAPMVVLVARFTIKTKHARVRHKVVFDAGKSTGATAFAWSFGDGKKGKGRRVSHAYRKAKTYKVTLTIRDAAGHSAKVTRRLKVRR